MSILYTLFLYWIAFRLFARDRNRKTYFWIGTIVTLLVILTDLPSILSLGIINYIKYLGWQVLVAYGLLLIFIFVRKPQVRRFSFERKKKKQEKQTFQTARSRGLFLMGMGILIALAGGGFILVDCLTSYDVPIVVYLTSAMAFVLFLTMGIIMQKKQTEKFVLLIWTEDGLDVYEHIIKDRFSFNYMKYIYEINRYYIIEKMSTIYYNGDYSEIHYVWLLKTQNIQNYDVNELKMDKVSNHLYLKIIDEITDGSRVIKIEVENKEIRKISKR